MPKNSVFWVALAAPAHAIIIDDEENTASDPNAEMRPRRLSAIRGMSRDDYRELGAAVQADTAKRQSKQSSRRRR